MIKPTVHPEIGCDHLDRLPLTSTMNKRQLSGGGGLIMSALLIEPILDRYVALAEKRERSWTPKEIEELLLKLREEVLHCLKR
jgi:hypothetical protein